MRLSRLILTAAVLALTCTAATAGPIRNAVARLTGRGCGGCQPAAGVRYSAPPTVQPQYTQPAPVTMPATGQTVHLASYVRGADAGPVAAPGYTPIRLGGVLPTVCGPSGCNR